MDLKWYVVYTKPNLEKKISEILSRKKIDNYTPVNNTSNDTDDNKKVKSDLLFENYLFVKCLEEQHEEIKNINGIVNFVYWIGKPVIVRNLEIKVIKLFLNEYTNVTLEKTELKFDNIGANGNYNNEQEAPMITIKNKKAYVGLPSLGYIMTAEVETSNVRIISSERTINQSTLKQNKLFSRVSELNNSIKNYLPETLVLATGALLLAN